jgi:fructokinase
MEVCQQLLADYELQMLVLTKGTQGSYVLTATETSFQPTPQVEVADTVGAGDSFTAAFVASLLKGISIAQAHKTAVEVSAYVCTQHGAMPVLPQSLIQ